MSDDIVIFGSNEQEHNQRLEKVLDRLETSGLTANLEKCLFRQPEIEFYGVKFSKEGMSLCASRKEALMNSTPPKNASEVASFLGAAGYSARFIRNFSAIAEPLRELTHLKKNERFAWKEKHQLAFDELRRALKGNAVAYFNPNSETQVEVDASPVGLGAVLVQKHPDGSNRVVAYARRSLSQLERKYSQVEREALAVVYGCERFHLYIYGKPFKIITDARAIAFIYGNPAPRVPARIERWGPRLLPYQFEITHKPGKQNIADFFSRNPVEGATSDHQADEYVNMVVSHAMPIALSTQTLVTETEKDKVLASLAKVIGQPNATRICKGSKELAKFAGVVEEMTVTNNGTLLKGRKLVIPKSLEKTVVQLAHEGHIGVVKTKQLLREKVWFPGIDSVV